MARWLLDCLPLCGFPWRLGVATEAAEREAAYRLRHEVFFREQGYGREGWVRSDERDVDEFDDWCDHLILFDTASKQVIATIRAIPGAEALRRGGFYASNEFDYAPLAPIAGHILQGSRTCVASGFRSGLAFQYLSYGMELLLRRHGCHYFLGADSFRAGNIDLLNRIYAYVRGFASDPDWHVDPLPACQVAGLCEVPATKADEQLLPNLIRVDLQIGFRACGPPAWDPDFCCYDLLVLARRDRMSRRYNAFIERIERRLPIQPDDGISFSPRP
jgi:putative hemolysin